MERTKRARSARPRADPIKKKDGSSGLRPPTQLNRRSARLALRSRPVAKQERVMIPALIKQGKPAPPPVSEESHASPLVKSTSSGALLVEQEHPDGKYMQEEAPHIAPEKQEVRNGPAPVRKDSLVSSSGQGDDESLHPKGEEQVREEAEKHGENVPKVKHEYSKTTPVLERSHSRHIK